MTFYPFTGHLHSEPKLLWGATRHGWNFTWDMRIDDHLLLEQCVHLRVDRLLAEKGFRRDAGCVWRYNFARYYPNNLDDIMDQILCLKIPAQWSVSIFRETNIGLDQRLGRNMFNRRRLARERLEYYLVYLILAYRRLILIVGLLLIVFAIATIFLDRIAGFVALFPAIFLLLLGNSYNVVVYTARLVAWFATLWRQED